jgi:hypothetical protein
MRKSLIPDPLKLVKQIILGHMAMEISGTEAGSLERFGETTVALFQ